MNRMLCFQGLAPRLPHQAYGSGTRSQLFEAKRSPLEGKAAFRPDGSRRGYAACSGMPRPRGRRRNSPRPSARRQWLPNVGGYHCQAVRYRPASRRVWHCARCGLSPGSFQAPRKLLSPLPCPANVMRAERHVLSPGASISACPVSADNLQSLWFSRARRKLRARLAAYRNVPPGRPTEACRRLLVLRGRRDMLMPRRSHPPPAPARSGSIGGRHG